MRGIVDEMSLFFQKGPLFAIKSAKMLNFDHFYDLIPFTGTPFSKYRHGSDVNSELVPGNCLYDIKVIECVGSVNTNVVNR